MNGFAHNHDGGNAAGAFEPAPVAPALDPRVVAAEETAFLFRLSPGSIINSIVPAFILTVVMAFAVGVFLPAIWLSVVLCLTASRLLLDSMYQRAPHRWSDVWWKRLVILYQFAHGTTWATTLWLLVLARDVHLEGFLIFLGILPTIGVITSHRALPNSIIAFTTPFSLAFAIYFLSRDVLIAQVLGGLWLANAAYHVIYAYGIYGDVVEFIKLRLLNAQLFEQAKEEKTNANQALRYLHNVLNTLDYGIIVLTKDFRIAAWNDGIVNMGLMPAGKDVKGLKLAEIIRENAVQGIYDSPESPDETAKRVTEMLKTARRHGGHVTRRSMADGREIEVRIHSMPNGDIVMSVIDVTEHKKAVIDTIRHMAYHDGLTDLPNRTAFRSKLEEALMTAAKSGSMVGVLIFDIERFHDINDTMGHRVGDHILRTIATRLVRDSETGDSAARLSSDEFAVIVGDHKTADEIIARGKQILDSLHDPIDVGDKHVHIEVSAGISIYPENATTVDQMMSNADLALNKAKHNTDERWVLFDESLNSEAVEANTLQNDLRRALERDEFTIHYQPQIDFHTGRAIGAEALIRWEHSERGWVPPAKFIPVAELSRLIVPLTEWILPTACKEAKAWLGRGWTDFIVSVNLSPLHFKTDGLVELVYQSLVASGLPPENLELELTEGMVIPDAERVLAILNSLAELGIRLAIDDFGTGYSSMAYLKAFPFHKLKVDRSFINDLTKSPETESIVEAIIRVGHTLGHQVVAEGVETAKQEAILKRLGCDGAQGFYYSKALPPQQFVEWVQAHKAFCPSSKRACITRLEKTSA